MHGRAALAVLGVGAVVQAWVLSEVVRSSWSGDGRLGALAGMLAWSPWPAAAVVAVAVAACAVTAVLARDLWRPAGRRA